MEKPEIQEMLEGMLNDEQTAEVLHRMSVSPERLSEFRQHMALRGEMARDARGETLTEDEDNRIWAAVLGATGGLVTGGTAVGSGVVTWLGRGAALLVTGIAGFFIGSAVNDGGDSSAPSTSSSTLIERNAEADRSAPSDNLVASSGDLSIADAADRIDTVFLTRTVVEPRVVYRDREKIVYRERESLTPDAVASTSAQTDINGNGNGNGTDESTAIRDESRTATASTTVDFGSFEPSPRYRSSNPFIPTELLGAAPVRVSVPSVESSTANGTNTPSSVATRDSDRTTDQAPPSSIDPNSLINGKHSERSPKSEDAKLIDIPSLSLMQNRIEIGYAERLGRVAPAPEVQGRSEPGFDARSIDITARQFGGRMGFGIRLLYGAFSEISYERELNFDLGIVDTLYVETLGASEEFNPQFFVNYRIPLGSERLALGLEVSSGLSSRRFTLSGDATLIYLITDWLGAQAGVGLGSYWYTTDGARASLLEENINAGITPGLPDNVQGTMVEGRYGLFYRF